MLRRRPDDSFELRYIEHALRSINVRGLGAERKDALRARIMANLADQDPARSFLANVAREHWVLVPAGIGIIGTILATAIAIERLDHRDDSTRAVIDGGLVPLRSMSHGQVYATADQWVSFRQDLAVGMEQGSEIRYETVDGVTAVRLLAGHLRAGGLFD